MEAVHRKYHRLTSLVSLWHCVVLTGWYWVSTSEAGHWTTNGRSFVIPDIFCNHAVYVSIWVVEVEEVVVKFVSRNVHMNLTISGNTLRSIALPCEKGNWANNVTSAYSMTSSADVAVYIEYSHDEVMVRPLASLGSNFVIPTLTGTSSIGHATHENFIAITSVSDRTEIELRFTDPKRTQPRCGSFKKSEDGEFYTLKLDKFLTALTSSAVSFSGTRINGSGDLLVLVGKIRRPGSVLMIEQLPAIQNYGKEYFLYVTNLAKGGATVYVSGLGTPTNFTVQTKFGKSESFVDGVGNSSIHVPKGGYAFIQSINANLAVTRHEPAQYDPNDTRISIEAPVSHYQNLANLKIPRKETNDSYILVTMETCNKLHPTSNISGLVFLEKVATTPGWIFTVYRTSYHTLQNNIVNDTKLLGSGLLYHGFIFRRTRRSFHIYPFPVHSFPVVKCPDIKLKSASGGNPPATDTVTQTTSWLPNYLRGNGIDDDCDGTTDEELLNWKDDDSDGLVDEDIVFGCWESGEDVNSTSDNTQRRSKTIDISGRLDIHPSNSYYHASIVALVASLAVALWAAAMLLGGSLICEYHRRQSARRSTSVSPIIED